MISLKLFGGYQRQKNAINLITQLKSVLHKGPGIIGKVYVKKFYKQVKYFYT